MFDYTDPAQSYRMMVALQRLAHTTEAVLNGNVYLTTDPTLSDPANQIWAIESNLLRHLLCEIYSALGEQVPPESNYKGVKYYHAI